MKRDKRNIVFGYLGLYLDRDIKKESHKDWRPTVSMFEHEEFPLDEIHLIHPSHSPDGDVARLLRDISEEIGTLSPGTLFHSHTIDFDSPWDFREVYGRLYELCEGYTFDTEACDYYFHITVGTHVEQICAYLLTESHRFPGKLLQTYGQSPYRKNAKAGYVILDPRSLPISIKEKSRQKRVDNATILKSGFVSINGRYNAIIEDLRQAAENSREPILILGETGTGKSVEARRIYQVKKNVFNLQGKFIAINCATLTRELAVATLFGYRKGDYSGAGHDQPGVIQQADGGMLFLDEIGELSLEIQAMLLQALETKRFKVFGIHEEIEADFQLVCGTNRNLEKEVLLGHFREDLLARINFWTFTLPPLRQRTDDIPELVNFFMDEWSAQNGETLISFEKKARSLWLAFAASHKARWRKNLRELNHSVKKMCYYARSAGDIITGEITEKEMEELRYSWEGVPGDPPEYGPEIIPLPEALEPHLSRADKLALGEAFEICRRGGSLKDVGEALFGVESDKRERNYSDLARKFLDRCTDSLPGSRLVLKQGRGLILIS